MTTEPTWVRCGEVGGKGIPKSALALSLAKAGNLAVDIDGIDHQLTGRLGAPMRDLIRIATYVLAADSATSRGDALDDDLGEKWHRDFRLVVAVEEPDRWQEKELRSVLESTLGTLSDDTFTFDFRPSKGTRAEGRDQLNITGPKGTTLIPWDRVEEVLLLSGGLDSLAGAVEEVVTQRRNVILVSHNSGTKTCHVQRELVQALWKMCREERRAGPTHVEVEMKKRDNTLRVERTQRTRSFLYAAIAGAVADLVGLNHFRFYENGVIALHLPKSPQLVGSRGTRTAHPKFLSGMARLIGLLRGKPMKVENPFVLKTREEVLVDLAKTRAASLISKAVSCAYVTSRTALAPHCGACSQCVDRRFAVVAGGLEVFDPEAGYKLQLATDPWPRVQDRLQLLAYVDSAYRFADCTSAAEFLAEVGEASRAIPGIAEGLGTTADRAGEEIFRLHRRHGESVSRALSTIMARAARALHDGQLSDLSLPMLIVERGKALRADQGVDGKGPANRLEEAREGWTGRFREGAPFTLPPSAGLTFIAQLLARPGQVASPTVLLSSHFRDQAPVGAETLLEGMDSETLLSLKKRVRELKEEREGAEACGDVEGVKGLTADINAMEPVLEMALVRGVRERTSGDQERVKRYVISEIESAMRIIGEHSVPMAAHLRQSIVAEFLCWYRPNGVSWVVSRQPAGRSVPNDDVSIENETPGPQLRIDLARPSVEFCGVALPVSGSDAFQRAQILALVVLAQQPGMVLSTDAWGQGMRRLGWRAGEGVAPDRRMVLRIRDRLAEAATQGGVELDTSKIVESIYGRGYRLNLKATDIRVESGERSAA